MTQIDQIKAAVAEHFGGWLVFAAITLASLNVHA